MADGYFGGGLVDIFALKPLLICALIFVPLERLLALHPQQKVFRKGLSNDVICAMLNSAIMNVVMILITALAVSAAALLVPEKLGQVVSGQATWLQIVEIIIIADLGEYAAHRAFHAFPALWKFHAIHHSIEELDWLATFRAHPVDQIVTKGASLLPIFFLGFSTEAIAIYFLIYTGHAILLHANVRINFGPVKWLIASPQFHHWHHADHREAYDKNFASQLSLIDALFGTFHVPGSALPEKYGVEDPVPASYLGQFGYPFRSRDQERGNAAVGTVKPASDPGSSSAASTMKFNS